MSLAFLFYCSATFFSLKSTISVSFVYLAYIIADQFFETSGILTIFFLGTHISTHMPSMFPGLDEDPLHAVWEFIVHSANTVLFTLVGVITALNVTVTFWDVVNSVILYIAMHVARFVMVMAFMPFMRMASFKPSMKDVWLLVHAGLRGGVATTLALFVAQNQSGDVAPNFLKLTVGCAALTLLFNAPTAKLMVSWIGHNTQDLYRHEQMLLALNYAKKKALLTVIDRKTEPLFSMCNWRFVEGAVQDLRNPYENQGVRRQTRVAVTNSVLRHAFKTCVWRMRDEGTIGESVARELIAWTRRGSALIDIAKLPPIDNRALKVLKFIGITSDRFPWLVRFEDSDKRNRFIELLAAYEGFEAMHRTANEFIDDPTEVHRVLPYIDEQKKAIQSRILGIMAADEENVSTAVTRMVCALVLESAVSVTQQLRVDQGLSVPVMSTLVREFEKVRSRTRENDIPETNHLDVVANTVLCGGDAVLAARLISAGDIVDLVSGSEIQSSAGVYVVIVGVLKSTCGYSQPSGTSSVLGVAQHMLGVFNRHKTWKTLCASTLLYIPINCLLTHNPILLWRCAAMDIMIPLLLRFPQTADLSVLSLRQMLNDTTEVWLKAAGSSVPEPGNDSAVFFLTGSDTSGLFTPLVRPVCIPRQFVPTLQWTEGAVLCIVRLPKAKSHTLDENPSFSLHPDLSASYKIGFGLAPRAIATTNAEVNSLVLEFISYVEYLEFARLSKQEDDVTPCLEKAFEFLFRAAAQFRCALLREIKSVQQSQREPNDDTVRAERSVTVKDHLDRIDALIDQLQEWSAGDAYGVMTLAEMLPRLNEFSFLFFGSLTEAFTKTSPTNEDQRESEKV